MLVHYRMANSKFVLFGLICFMLLICGCRSDQTDTASSTPLTETPTIPPTLTPSRTPIPTKTRLPTRTKTIVPSLTLIPTNTQTLTRTPGPSPTPTLTPTSRIANLHPNDLVFPTHELFNPLSLPVAPPEGSADELSLKSWSYNSAIDLIYTMDQYAYAHNLDGASSDRSRFRNAQSPKIIAIQEALTRYPVGNYNQDVKWQLAASNFIQNKTVSNAWIIEQIEDKLNQTGGNLEILESFLIRNKFFIHRATPVNNLFGDFKDATVLEITSLDSYGSYDSYYFSGGLVLAIRKNNLGRYEATTIVTHMNFEYAIDQLQIDDLNQNGQPDVIYVYGAHSGSMCSFEINVFEWQDNEFKEFTDGQIEIRTCPGEWQIGESPITGEKFIKIMDYWYERTEIFQWTGESYTAVRQEFANGLNAFEVFLGNMEVSKAAAEALELISSWDKSDDTEYGPGVPDYLRFQLGVAYGLQGESRKAQTNIQAIVAEPYNADYPAIANASEVFLENYQNSQDLYRACKAAKASLWDTIPSSRQANFDMYDDSELLLELWGFEGYSFYLMPYLCNEYDIFRYIVSNAKPPRGKDILDVLVDAGITITDSLAVDLDLDGKQDWLIRADTSLGYGSTGRSTWMLLSSDRGYDLYNLGGGELESIEIEHMSISQSGEMLTLVQEDDSFYVFQIDEEDGKKFLNLILDRSYNVDRFEVNMDKGFPYITIYYILEESYTRRIFETYRWDLEKGYLRSFDLIAYTMFDEGNLEEAVALIEEQLAKLEGLEDQAGYGADRYYYLLGLAYEWMGEERAAVEAYWKVWHDFPESGYAVMARAKLE
ncbi:MAG: hypothetical protein JXB38_01165 [Anaerolineales bacterium]|nr:hypothetical protein [Anaerolineales bacterium]